MLAIIGAIITVVIIPLVTTVIPALQRLKQPKGHIVAIDENIELELPPDCQVILAHDYRHARHYSVKGHVLLRTHNVRERAKAEFEIVTKVTNERQLWISDKDVIKNLFDDPLT
jgi:hypothetical protein